MSDTGKPATGPLIMEQLLLLAEEVKALRESQERRDQQFRALSDQIDRFLAAEIDLGLTLVSVREVVGFNRDTVNQLRLAAIDLERTINAALDLTIGDPAVQEQEHDRAA